MKLLIIDDSEEKLTDLIEWASENFNNPLIVTAKSLHTGKSAALDPSLDLVLLDMTMRNYERSPEEDGGRPHAFAGREILRRMHREGITTPVIVVTQFDRFSARCFYEVVKHLFSSGQINEIH